MQPILFVMAILGCGEGDAPCREVVRAEASYRSEADCLAASAAEIARHDILYPTVVAQCRADARPQLLRASQVMLPEGGPLDRQQPRFAARSSR